MLTRNLCFAFCIFLLLNAAVRPYMSSLDFHQLFGLEEHAKKIESCFVETKAQTIHSSPTNVSLTKYSYRWCLTKRNKNLYREKWHTEKYYHHIRLENAAYPLEHISVPGQKNVESWFYLDLCAALICIRQLTSSMFNQLTSYGGTSPTFTFSASPQALAFLFPFLVALMISLLCLTS